MGSGVGFTSRAVGINCCYPIEVGSLLWKILISEGASFFIDSYHPIPGEKKGKKCFIQKLGVFFPLFMCVLRTGS